jgi:ribosomal protein L37AE/L43A
MPNEYDIEEDWPDCIQCGSDETAVVPLTGEWECSTCGCQWNFDELTENDEQAEEIPNQIEVMLETIARD